MADKKPAKNVHKLITDATSRKPGKKTPTVGKRIRLIGSPPPPLPRLSGKPKARGKPNAVLKLIADALRRQGR